MRTTLHTSWRQRRCPLQQTQHADPAPIHAMQVRASAPPSHANADLDDRLGHEEYPSKFDVDMETRMLGSVKPYRRMVRARHPIICAVNSSNRRS